MNDASLYFVGLDMGSAFTKAVLLCRGRIMQSSMTASGGHYRDAAEKVVKEILDKEGIEFGRITGLTATGLGSGSCPFPAKKISDLSCQAMGCHYLFPSTRTVIDVGGQFTKTARITPEGRLADFLISEKCATGSGRFLQIMARILHIDISEIGPLSMASRSPVEFSTNCAVFAESEAVSRIAEGASPQDILAGVHRAMASKIAMLVKRVKMEQDIVLTGGSARDGGLVKAVEEALQKSILVPDEPMLTAAIGAACLAADDTPSKN